MAISLADRQLITVSSMPGPWAQVSGQEITREVQTAREKAGGPKIPLPNSVEFPDLQLQRLYDPERDSAIVRAMGGNKTFSGTSITVDTIDQDGIVIPGAKIVYTDCVLLSVSAPDGDANSTDMSMLQVTFKVGGLA